ncbi:MAG TPA: hypothetical protein IAA56_05355 [Candidatus Galloscillospira excrementavium]|nr:hypothetical protein [Candidatus Galloscillospira excrementavium]
MFEHDYRSYMDRVELGKSRHQQIMDVLREGRAPAGRGSRMAHYAVLAACLALVCAAGLGGLRYLGDYYLNQDLPAYETPGPATNTPGHDIPGDNPGGEGYTLLVGDPFDGQPHSSPMIPALAYPDCTDSPAVAGNILLPAGHFTEDMTASEIIAALGGGDQVPWLLYWAGFGVDGSVLYDGEGAVWQATLTGADTTGSGTTFTLALSPGRLPVRDLVYSDAGEQEVNGVTVTTWYYWSDLDGTYTYGAEFLSGDTGIRFTCTSADGERAALLTNCLVTVGTGGGFTTSHLTPDEIPEWRSESLTLAEARAETLLGAYVPDQVPSGFAFDGAHRELGQDRNYMTLFWSGYYTHISITIELLDDPAGQAVTDVDAPERYDVNRYETPWADSVPEAYRQEFDNPVFAAADLTEEVVSARMRYVTGDAGDVDGWRGDFSVLYTGGVLVRYDLKGVTPEQAYELTMRHYDVLPGEIVSVTGPEGRQAELTGEEAQTILSLLDGGQWAEGTSDCASDYALSCPGWGVLRYHSDCGTFNDPAGDRSLTLSDADREMVNRLLTGQLSLSSGEAGEEGGQGTSPQAAAEGFLTIFFSANQGGRYDALLSAGWQEGTEGYYAPLSALATSQCVDSLIRNRLLSNYDSLYEGQTAEVTSLSLGEASAQGVYPFTVEVTAGGAARVYTGQITPVEENGIWWVDDFWCPI